MPKFFCDYCDVYLTHDSMSVRKAHNSGRNHLRNVVEYYQQIGHEKAQSVIDSITSSYAAEGQSVPGMMQQPGSAFPPPPPGGFPGMPPPPFGMQNPGANGPTIPPMGGKGMPFPPPFPSNGQPPPNLPAGMPFPPAGGFPPNLQFPPPGGPGGFGPPPGQGPPGGMGFQQQGPGHGQQGAPPGFGMGAPDRFNDSRR